jgi:hypothetical protein
MREGAENSGEVSKGLPRFANVMKLIARVEWSLRRNNVGDLIH